MSPTNGRMEKAIADFKSARERFELYEKFYLSVRGDARRYLESESNTYKIALRKIQALILPGIGKICPVCETQCCRLDDPEISIYIACTVGGFGLKDYLLARCNAIWPDPRYENAVKNLCRFWNSGCSLPTDCRSFLCIQFFCDKLKKNLDMRAVTESLGKLRTILDSFSIGKCMA
jgi:hypothetical protein